MNNHPSNKNYKHQYPKAQRRQNRAGGGRGSPRDVNNPIPTDYPHPPRHQHPMDRHTIPVHHGASHPTSRRDSNNNSHNRPNSDSSSPNNSIFLIGVSSGTSKQDLFKFFSRRYPSIFDVKMNNKNRKNRKVSGHATIRFNFPDDVKKILKKKKFFIKGRELIAKPFLSGKQLAKFREEVLMRRLYVRGIPRKWRDERLERELSEFGAIEQAYSVKDDYKLSRGYGYVVFERLETAKRALRQGSVEFSRVILHFEQTRRGARKIKEFQSEDLRGSSEKEEGVGWESKRFSRGPYRDQGREESFRHNQSPEEDRDYRDDRRRRHGAGRRLDLHDDRVEYVPRGEQFNQAQYDDWRDKQQEPRKYKRSHTDESNQRKPNQGSYREWNPASNRKYHSSDGFQGQATPPLQGSNQPHRLESRPQLQQRYQPGSQQSQERLESSLKFRYDSETNLYFSSRENLPVNSESLDDGEEQKEFEVMARRQPDEFRLGNLAPKHLQGLHGRGQGLIRPCSTKEILTRHQRGEQTTSTFYPFTGNEYGSYRHPPAQQQHIYMNEEPRPSQQLDLLRNLNFEQDPRGSGFDDQAVDNVNNTQPVQGGAPQQHLNQAFIPVQSAQIERRTQPHQEQGGELAEGHGANHSIAPGLDQNSSLENQQNIPQNDQEPQWFSLSDESHPSSLIHSSLVVVDRNHHEENIRINQNLKALPKVFRNLKTF